MNDYSFDRKPSLWAYVSFAIGGVLIFTSPLTVIYLAMASETYLDFILSAITIAIMVALILAVWEDFYSAYWTIFKMPRTTTSNQVETRTE